MKICESWLREWVDPLLTTEALTNQLTMAGLEVDACYPVAGEFTNVIVAFVLETKPHPAADKLTLCKVDAGGDEPLQVVCGAKNVRKDLKVALATIGATLPGDIKIKACKLRGEASQGMLCSVTELGLEEQSDGILELPHDAPIGMDLREYLVLNDHILEMDLTPNRADCFSVLGLARDIAALNDLPAPAMPSATAVPTLTDTCRVEIQAKEACPQYAGRMIRGINPAAETPIWMKERLRRSGLRALHPVVDVLNYVMMELGQPMHAFDAQTIKGTICVRYAQKGESITLLDDQKITLDPAVLVIADDEKPLAMAGIMGGDFSSVKAHTTDIFLESAFFTPLALIGIARRFGLNTDASQRFERGVDPLLQSVALERATQLIQQIAGGEVGPLELNRDAKYLPIRAAISFHPKRVKQLSGLEIAESTMQQMLQRLGMQVVVTDAGWNVTPPSYRFDMAHDADVVEEIIRLYGYDKITATPTEAILSQGEINALDLLTVQISTFLAHKGYQETISYSFVDPEIQSTLYPEMPSLALVNPISPELSHMRTGLWSGLLASMIHNVHRQKNAFKLFESGVVFQTIEGELKEIPHLAGLMTGNKHQLSWLEKTRPYDFYDMKGDLQVLFCNAHVDDICFIADTHPALHPGKSARILRQHEPIGWLGVLHPVLMDMLDLSHDVILFELNLLSLLGSKKPVYQPLSKYPQTRRDLSLIVDEAISASQIEEVVRGAIDSASLRTFDVFDVYQGEGIPKGKKSLAIALTLQHDNRTLVDTEIQAMVAAILKKLESTFSVVLRAT